MKHTISCLILILLLFILCSLNVFAEEKFEEKLGNYNIKINLSLSNDEKHTIEEYKQNMFILQDTLSGDYIVTKRLETNNTYIAIDKTNLNLDMTKFICDKYGIIYIYGLPIGNYTLSKINETNEFVHLNNSILISIMKDYAEIDGVRIKYTKDNDACFDILINENNELINSIIETNNTSSVIDYLPKILGIILLTASLLYILKN